MEKERINRISESEWQIMDVVWQYAELSKSAVERQGMAGKETDYRQSGAGITQSCLMELLGDKWNKNTVHTFLKRLCDKGYLQVIKEQSPHRYVALVSREACEKEERQSFLDRVYQGSAGRMVAAFVRDGGLSEEDVTQLRRLLDEL
ncbi:MAG: BlaI/MecI/CopY family transcriptional regulator [Lachnospiraceae bacterium]|nr:BlaI/MecI/CopY family transcriptional regulator [Lachnospiraceae bacterium]